MSKDPELDQVRGDNSSADCFFEQNICAVLTAPGRGAIGVIAVSGPLAETTLDKLFVSASGTKLSGKARRRIYYGNWVATGEDIVLVRNARSSFEIHCHGGKSAPASILCALQESEFRILEQVEMARVLNNGLWKSELAIALTQALSEKTAGILLQQYSLADDQLAEMELLIENSPDQAIEKLGQMNSWSEFARHLTQPWSVVFTGRPNVGKSSLMNAVVGFNRVIVHELAGTTRDVVSHLTAVSGWPIELKDTAGLRTSTNSIEKIGLDLAQIEIRDADLVVAVIDASQALNEIDKKILKLGPAILVANKFDLMNDRAFDYGEAEAIKTSATTGQGIQLLIDSIAERLVDQLPASDVLLPVNSRQVSVLETVMKLLVNKQRPHALDAWRRSV